MLDSGSQELGTGCRGLIGKEYHKEFTELRPENSKEFDVGIADSEDPHFEEAIKENEKLKINEILNWQYKYKESEKIPTKTSVSQIKNRKENPMGIATLSSDLYFEEATQNEKRLKTPNFEKEEKITEAQKGTLIHLCIKNLNEKKDYEVKDIIELIQNLQNKNIITKKEAESINTKILLQFTKSNLFKKLKEAKEIHKEEPFYINIPASEIYNNQVEENVLVQGIIDLYYIDKQGNIVLVDYKTDYVQNENELIEKYKEQLNLYKKALEGALKKQVEKVIIYSTYLQKEISVL